MRVEFVWENGIRHRRVRLGKRIKTPFGFVWGNHRADLGSFFQADFRPSTRDPGTTYFHEDFRVRRSTERNPVPSPSDWAVRLVSFPARSPSPRAMATRPSLPKTSTEPRSTRTRSLIEPSTGLERGRGPVAGQGLPGHVIDDLDAGEGHGQPARAPDRGLGLDVEQIAGGDDLVLRAAAAGSLHHSPSGRGCRSGVTRPRPPGLANIRTPSGVGRRVSSTGRFICWLNGIPGNAIPCAQPIWIRRPLGSSLKVWAA